MRKKLIRLASLIFPGKVVDIAYRNLLNPQVSKLRPHEVEVLDKAEKEKYAFQNFQIQKYKWGNPSGEKILLIHGWEGQAGNFADIIERLVDEGYYIISFDAPSHGFSSKGETSLFEFSDLVAEVIKQYSISKIISHSFGGVATTYALFKNQDIHINKYLLLTTPDFFIQRIDAVSEYFGITEKVKQRLISRIEKEMDMDINSIAVSMIVKDINVEKALIIHDKNDKVIPIAYSKNVHNNWPNCEFKTIEGTGHFRILRTPKVIDDVIRFIIN